jgi:hypothetical protein
MVIGTAAGSQLFIIEADFFRSFGAAAIIRADRPSSRLPEAHWLIFAACGRFDALLPQAVYRLLRWKF